MSIENVVKFCATVRTHSELYAQTAAIDAADELAFAEQFARLSLATDTPFTAEEFLAHRKDQSSEELSHDQLTRIVGGTRTAWRPPNDRFFPS